MGLAGKTNKLEVPTWPLMMTIQAESDPLMDLYRPNGQDFSVPWCPQQKKYLSSFYHESA